MATSVLPASSLLAVKEAPSLAELADEELSRIFPSRSIKRVLFVAPPDADESLFSFGTAKRGRYWNYPPYGAGILASHLRNDGITVDIVNLNNTILRAARSCDSATDMNYPQVWKNALEEKISKLQPDLIGVSCMFSQTHPAAVAVVNEIKKNHPEIPLTMGGVHITNSLISEAKVSEALLQDLRLAEFFFVFESDLAFRTFVRVVNRQLPATELAQVYFNSHPDKLFFTNRVTPTQPEELDTIPAFDLMEINDLSNNGTIGSFFCLREEGARFSTVLSNRGCRAQCTFCSVRNFNGVGVRSRSVQSVIDEIKILREVHGIDHIMWLDDDFLYDHDRALRLLNEMVRQKVGITWDCSNGVLAASCTEELMSAAVASGCLGFNIGMESGNPQILKEIKKPANVETLLRASEVLKKYEQINARVFLIIGFPGESYNMILDTINVSFQMNLDWYNVTILQPLPNTPIFKSMVAQGLISEANFKDIRYNTGVYGKHRKLAEERRIDMLSTDFKNAFNQGDLEQVPHKEQLDNIWAYMNYHLNFRRLFQEKRPVKLDQQLKYVKNIADLVAPENAFAMYFTAYLQQKIHGKLDSVLIDRLTGELEQSPYWRNRFEEFQLSVDHLRTGQFPEK